MNRKLLRVGLVGGLALAVLVAVLLVKRPFGHKIVVKAYFANAMSLRAGAPVRLAGVDIGSVQSVRARPELKEAPAEVVMILTPSYELRIPNDSTASVETAGVLGEAYVDIDVGHTSGPPIGSNAVLRTVATPQVTIPEFIEKVGDILSRKCDCDSGKTKNGSQPR
jgi:phospholipid/cholesterol/gamma-HCH transport system substrate-binding protein